MATNGGYMTIDTASLGLLLSGERVYDAKALECIERVRAAMRIGKPIWCNGFTVQKGTDATTLRKFSGGFLELGSSDVDGQLLYFSMNTSSSSLGIRINFDLRTGQRKIIFTLVGA